ncbi:hypothetical protein LshimejAT787_0803970 [Lyophyllum shimeji]|uniref:Uncharacterized protein n=1 Tax=Lyophyllum shimeji TaxID=47721 RepID=A0A9P3URU9_LYOSH|nr:hypothetical protein LshimejAT787_0803970 [Lyophyllum shimeji]
MNKAGIGLKLGTVSRSVDVLTGSTRQVGQLSVHVGQEIIAFCNKYIATIAFQQSMFRAFNGIFAEST